MLQLDQIREVARQHRVKRLELFGSAARGGATPGDFDFLVEFEPMEPIEHGRAYFRLLESLEHTLGAPVDLVELEAISNPFFLKSIASDRVLVYAA